MASQMSTRSASQDVGIPTTNFKAMILNKFSVKKHFEIGFISAASADDEAFLEDLIKLNRSKEDITNVAFIERKEVENFIETSHSTIEFEYPPYLQNELRRFAENYTSNVFDDEENDENQAFCIKFKLLHKMYEQYGKIVKQIKHSEILNKELEQLAGQKVTTKKTTPEKVKKQQKSDEALEVLDYTKVELLENDLIVDDALENQVFFYIFVGYENINLIKYLQRIKIKISFIIKISKYSPKENKNSKELWNYIENLTNELQYVALLKYEALPEETIENCLKNLLDIVKNLIDLKRLHFKYIKSLKIVDSKFTETFRSFPNYEKLTSDYPIECLSIPYILHGILHEIQIRSEKITKPTLSITCSPPKHKLCPFKITTHLKTKQKFEQKQERKPFKIYKTDILKLIFKSYNVDVDFIQNNFNMLKLQTPITLVKCCEFQDNLDDFLPHTHDVSVPNDKDLVFTDQQTDHLINLLYLRNKIFSEPELKNEITNEFIENLIVHNKNKYIDELSVKILENSVTFTDENEDSNMYEIINPLTFHWAEFLTQEVLLQNIQESELKFEYCDFIYCDVTNSMIARYHNDVNSFGLSTRTWSEYLRTPVALGDFCKHTFLDDYDWFLNNETTPQISYLDVVERMEDQTNMRLYSDDLYNNYKHLLVPQIQYSNSDVRKTTVCPCLEENVCELAGGCKEKLAENYPEYAENLKQILDEFNEYNEILDLSKHCKRKDDKDYSFLAYNFGPSKFGIIGHTTDFVSYDGVKITVDTCRFSNEKFKLTLKLKFDDNIFVLHTPENNFLCHLLLADGTLIVFSKPFNPIKNPSDIKRKVSSPQIADIEDESLDNKQTLSDFCLKASTSEEEISITVLDSNYYNSLETHADLDSLILETSKDFKKKQMKKDMDILKRLQANPHCLKISRRNSRYLEKKVPENNVAVSQIIKRILNNHKENQKCGIAKRKCRIKNEIPTKKNNLSFNIYLTIPNGLTIKLLQLENKRKSCVLKQSYEFSSPPEEISNEQYRLFTDEGTIIVRKMDGTIILLTSSGKEISFTKPSSTKEEDFFCKLDEGFDEDTVRNILSRLMSTFQEEPSSEYYASRRGHFHAKYRELSATETLSISLSKIPYDVITLITHDGEKFTFKKQKLYKTIHSRIYTEINFQTEKKTFKRQDGFFSTTDKDGTRYVAFPDGTMINTAFYVEEKPVFFRKGDKMGWIVVTATFSYEHPFYKPVFFDNLNSNIELRLNENDFLKITQEGGRMYMKNSTLLDIDKAYINFTKECPSCEAMYKCKLYIEPLYHNKKIEDIFLIDVEDSYEKVFKVDFAGNCKVKQDYINGIKNKNNCNHFNLADHQKIYLIKKDLSGMALWNDKIILKQTKMLEETENINHFNDSENNLIFLTITKNIYNKFNERFFGKVLRNEISDLIYQTTQSIHNMFDLHDIDGLMKCLKDIFQEKMLENLAVSLMDLRDHLKMSRRASIRSMPSQSISSINEISSSDTPFISLHEKLMELSKNFAQAKQIFKLTIPSYFNSDCCTFIESLNDFSDVTTSETIEEEKEEEEGVLV